MCAYAHTGRKCSQIRMFKAIYCMCMGTCVCGRVESIVKCECFKVIYALDGFVKIRKNISDIYHEICGKYRLSTQGLQFQQTWHRLFSICCSQGLELKQ
jgi:hypothetical protein